MRSGKILAWSLGLTLVAVVSLVAQTTPEQNSAAFAAAAAQTNLSYHWDHMDSGSPAVATTPRTPLPYAPTLTTINFDSEFSTLYQEKTIGGVTYDCVLVGTFTNPNAFWNQSSGTTLTLTYGSSPTHYIFPYVTVGDDLRNYLQDTYFPDVSESAPTDAEVALRITQSLGLSPAILPTTTRGLAFFWVPIDHVVRSGYSPDIRVIPEDLAVFSDGSFQPDDEGLSPDFRFVDVVDNAQRFDTNTVFVEHNGAQTTYPWTAMGYTYNWNALQDGSIPGYGYDPQAPSSFIGLSEFMVSGGSQVLLESWIPYDDLDSWVAVPEPHGLLLFVVGTFLLILRRQRPAGTDGTASA
jgi:hypothetical protein